MMNRVFRDLEHKRQQDDGDTGSRHPAPMTDRTLAHKGLATGKATTPRYDTSMVAPRRFPVSVCVSS